MAQFKLSRGHLIAALNAIDVAGVCAGH